MRKVCRASEPVPLSLIEDGGPGARERARALIHYASANAAELELQDEVSEGGLDALNDSKAPKAFNFVAYKGDDVKDALARLFHDKCAYCESVYGAVMHMQVEHYRPKGRVFEDQLHPGYWWLASEWTNLLPSCAHCNGSGYHLVHVLAEELPYTQRANRGAYLLGKLNYFPVAAQRACTPEDHLDHERAQILDPTQSDPEQYLNWIIVDDLSLVAARYTNGVPDPLGFTTYRLLGLNRQKLVEQRTQLMLRIALELQEIRDYIEEAVQTEDPGTRERSLARADSKIERVKHFGDADQPYSMMAKAMIEAQLGTLEALITSFTNPQR